MDLLVDMILDINTITGGNLLKDGQIASIVAYLQGDEPLENIVRFLPKTSLQYNRQYFYPQQFSQISDACSQSPELLLRLGRYIELLDALDPNECARQLHTFTLYLPTDALFIISALHSKYYWVELFEYTRDHFVIRSSNYSKLFNHFEYFINKLDELDYQSAPIHMRLLIQLYQYAKCAKEPFDAADTLDNPVNRMLGEAACSLIDSNTMYCTFLDLLMRYCPAAVPYVKIAHKNHTANQSDLNMTFAMFFAFAATHVHGSALGLGKLHNLDGFLKSLVEADYTLVLKHFTPLVLNQLPSTKVKFNIWQDAGFNPAYLLANLMDIATSNTGNRSADKIADVLEPFSDKQQILKEAAAVAQYPEIVFIHRALVNYGGAFPEAVAEKSILWMFHNVAEKDTENADKLAQWLITGKGELSALPDILSFVSLEGKRFYDSSFMIKSTYRMTGVLFELHPAYERFIRYATHFQISDLLYSLLALPQRFGYSNDEATAQTISELGITDEIIRLIPNNFFHQPSDEDKKNIYIYPIYEYLIKNNPGAAASAIQNKRTSAASRLHILHTLYEVHPNYDYALLINCLGDSAKTVRDFAISILKNDPSSAAAITPLLDAPKKVVRESAQAILAYHNDYHPQEQSDDNLAGECAKLTPKNALRSISWALESIPEIRTADLSGKVEEQILICYLYHTLSAKTIELLPILKTIKPMLHTQDMLQLARHIYSNWISNGAPAKTKGVLLLYGLFAEDSDILILQRQIESWASNARGAIASDAVRAIAYCGSDLALLTIDQLSRKFKNKQVRRTASDSLELAAAELGITTQDLGDRIIPTLGFDIRGEKTIDYGDRQFKAKLSPTLSIILQDSAGKIIKSLPKPGAKDDAQTAQREQKAFASLKKSLKTIVQNQTSRLEIALSTGRIWHADSWQQLFTQNPIMSPFATSLIWGHTQDGTGIQTFRCLEDGSYTGPTEQEIEPATITGSIELMHPLNMTPQLISEWLQQLDDYEVAQPFAQLTRKVYKPELGELNEGVIKRFAGIVMPGIVLLGKLQKQGWYKGDVEDGGFYFTFYKTIGDIVAVLRFSGMSVVADPQSNITIGLAGFNRTKTPRSGIPLKDISPILLSEILLELTAATAGKIATDENWHKNPLLRSSQWEKPE